MMYSMNEHEHTNNKTTTQHKWGNTMTRKMKRQILLAIAVLMIGCANGACGNDVTDVNVGDETANEIVDDVLETADDVNESTFMKLWAATSFDTIDECFTECDETYTNGTDDNVDCAEQCKIEFAE